jgi:tRNA-binding protein
MNLAHWNDFASLRIHAGTIVEAEIFKEARKPAYKMMVDFGPTLGIKKSSAQITDLYEPENLIGKQVMAVINFAPKQIGPLMSECLVLGFVQEDNTVVLAVPDTAVENGIRLA